MTSDQQFTELLHQHIELLANIERLWTVQVIMAIFALFLFVAIVVGAVASVWAVNRRQRILEGKFTLLIDVLLQTVAKRNHEQSEPVQTVDTS